MILACETTNPMATVARLLTARIDGPRARGRWGVGANPLLCDECVGFGRRVGYAEVAMNALNSGCGGARKTGPSTALRTGLRSHFGTQRCGVCNPNALAATIASLPRPADSSAGSSLRYGSHKHPSSLRRHRQEKKARPKQAFFAMAETEGFEPSVPHSRYDGLANRWFQPLTHVSGVWLRRAIAGGSAAINRRDRPRADSDRRAFDSLRRGRVAAGGATDSIDTKSCRGRPRP